MSELAEKHCKPCEGGIAPMTREQAQGLMGSLASGWSLTGDGKGLRREFKFKDFSGAFAFMTRVALAAEKMDHHPDWSNSWNKVVIDIVSHAQGGITDQCVALATKINAIAAS